MDEAIYERLYATEEEHWWFQGRRAVIHALLERASVRPAARILDAGCGTGRNLKELEPFGQAIGVEPSSSAVEFANRRGVANIRMGAIEALPFDSDSFDLVTAFDVLEHLDDDIEGLRELRRVSTLGAALVATVPAYRWLWSQHDESHHHRRRYTRPELLAHAEEAGWRPLFATYFNSLLLPPIAAVRAFRRGHTEGGSTDYDLTAGPMNSLLALPMRLEARAIRRGIRFPAGVSVGMVCTAV